jgi:hypothetical protein
MERVKKGAAAASGAAILGVMVASGNASAASYGSYQNFGNYNHYSINYNDFSNYNLGRGRLNFRYLSVNDYLRMVDPDDWYWSGGQWVRSRMDSDDNFYTQQYYRVYGYQFNDLNHYSFYRDYSHNSED